MCPHIVIIGGGSGTAALYPTFIDATPHVTAIVSMSDNGGSTGEISVQLDILPVGDLRNVMLAASSNPAIRAMRIHRLGGTSSLRGHAWGNLTIAACIERYGLQEGVRQAGLIFQVPGRVLPVTLDMHTLVMHDGDETIRGEQAIDKHVVVSGQADIALEPKAKLNPEAETAIAAADLIVIGPGSVYTSLLPALSVFGMQEALAAAKAPKVLIANLVTEAHHTNGWHVVDIVHALEHHHIPLDYVIYNTQLPPRTLLASYLAEGEQMIAFTPERFKESPKVHTIGTALLADHIQERSPHDGIKRSVIRHNAAEVRAQLWSILGCA